MLPRKPAAAVLSCDTGDCSDTSVTSCRCGALHAAETVIKVISTHCLCCIDVVCSHPPHQCTTKSSSLSVSALRRSSSPSSFTINQRDCLGMNQGSRLRSVPCSSPGRLAVSLAGRVLRQGS